MLLSHRTLAQQTLPPIDPDRAARYMPRAVGNQKRDDIGDILGPAAFPARERNVSCGKFHGDSRPVTVPVFRVLRDFAFDGARTDGVDADFPLPQFQRQLLDQRQLPRFCHRIGAGC